MDPILIDTLPTVTTAMDQPLEQDTIFILLHTPRQTQIHEQILDGPTIHQLATVMRAHSHDHSLRVVFRFSQTKLKSFTKQPEEKRIENSVLTDIQNCDNLISLNM